MNTNQKTDTATDAAQEGATVRYTAKTHTSGGRRGGVSSSDDGRLDVKFSAPGVPGTGTDPEQLFAAGTCAIPATSTSSGHGSTSACRVWSAKSPRPSWTPRTARRVPIPTLHGATSRLRSTWCKPDRSRPDAPDLRGLGLSSKPDRGYDKKTQAADVVGVLDALGVPTAELVTHDLGIMVGFAIAATHPERVSRWVAIDAPLPGVGPWDEIRQDPAMWHFGFGGPDMERLVAGRERIYLERFWNELSRDPKRFDEAKRQHYAALYAQPGAMRASFAQFLAFSQDAADNRPSAAKLPSAL